MPGPYINRFGRRGGRGIRPWFLLPKVIAVGLYLGGLAAALVIWLAAGFSALDAADPQRLRLIGQMRLLMLVLVVPALLAVLVLGLLLLLQHPRQLIRMRWIIVKLGSVAVVITGGHLFVSSRLRMLREAYRAGVADDSAALQFALGLAVVLAGSIWIIILGRLKPRLGQNWARAYPR
jgi:uncharacterized membrane protein